MNDYGLVVNNAAGDIMFDSRRQMDSYVVASYGNASSVTTKFGDLVFVKGDSSVSDELIYIEPFDFSGGSTTTRSFFKYDPTTQSSTAVSLDYIHVAPSANIAPDTGDDYGLLIKSPDGSVQFDSRSIKSDAHYSITDVWRRLELFGNGTGPTLTTTSAEYVELTRSTSVSVSVGESVRAIKFTGTNGNVPKYMDYIVTGIFNPVLNYRNNTTAIFIAELDV